MELKITSVNKNVLCADLGDLPLTDSGAVLPWEPAGDCRVTASQEGEGLTFRDEKGRLLLPIETFTPGEAEGFTLRIRLKPEERVYGLGEDNDAAYGSLNRRGTVREFLTGQRINQNHVTADFPIPFFLMAGKTPYGFYLDNTSCIRADIGKKEPDILHITAPCGGCRLYVIAGETLPDIVTAWADLTGHSALPPLWVLGYLQSKCAFWDWEEVEDAIESFRQAGVPLESIIFDFNWARTFNDFHWADRWQGLSAEKIHEYRQKYGIRFMASNSGPMLKKDSCTYESALEQGLIARDAKGELVTCGYYSGELIDYTNPKTEAWLKPQLAKIMADGVESWWLDLTEPEGDSETTQYHAGSRGNIHNIFSNAVTETFQNVMESQAPGKRNFVLTRTGTAGIQRRPTALWTGDIYSEYGTLQAHVPEALNTQLSGIAMWTCDTGGFLSPTNNEACPYNLYHNDQAEHGLLYERWMQFSAFTPILRSHHAGGESVPFRYADGFVDGMARYIRLRYRLIPYIYSLYYENWLRGIPIMRPLFWHDPDSQKAYECKDEYFFGENLLVAPVLTEKTDHRTVYFPAGKWIDLDYGHVYQGGSEAEVFAPQSRIPVFVRAGAIIPQTKAVLNTREINMGSLDLEIWPEGDGSFTLYADDGETIAYQQGDCTATVITCREAENRVKVSICADNDRYPLREAVVILHMKQKPSAVILNGKPVRPVTRQWMVRRAKDCAYCFDEFNRKLLVKLHLCGDDTLEVALVPDTDFPEIEAYAEEKLAGQLPYIYPPAQVPCVIDAIHYDRGGEGIAYHRLNTDTEGLYRKDNAGIAEDAEGLFISQLKAGEWLAYSISCGREGSYDIFVEGIADRADMTVQVGSSIANVTAGRARMELGTGNLVLRLTNHSGNMDIRKIRILPAK